MGKKLNENLHNDEKDVIKKLNKAIKDSEELVTPNDQIKSYNTNITLQDESISPDRTIACVFVLALLHGHADQRQMCVNRRRL